MSRRRRLADGRMTAHLLPDENLQELRAQGLVPVLACEVVPGDRIASVQTWFGMRASEMTLQTVTAVSVNDWGGVVIETATSVAEEDDGLPVWILEPKEASE